MSYSELASIVEAAGFKYDYSYNEYNERCHQLISHGEVVYESYNEYCLIAFIEGASWSASV